MYSISSQVSSFVIANNFQTEALIEHGIYKIGPQKISVRFF